MKNRRWIVPQPEKKQKQKEQRKFSFALSFVFDSPVIYGVRVETSNPYHLLYIESYIKLSYAFSIPIAAKNVKSGF